MAIHPREVGGELFLADEPGKHERLLTPDEFRASRSEAIEAHDARLADLRRDEQKLLSRLEAALVRLDEPADVVRAELAACREAITLCEQGIHQSVADVAALNRLMDSRAAQQLEEADRARIAALTQPFDRVLQEYAE